MKKNLSLLTLGAALIAVPVLAAPGGAGSTGVQTRADVQSHATDMFAKMDVNKDGRLDAADRDAKRAERQAKMFASLDADGNGSISKAEWDQHGADRSAKRAQRAEKRAAVDKVSEGKRHGMRGHHGMAGRMLGKADTNGDKAISQAEFQAAALARFDAADANKDGQLTAEERKAQRDAWKAKAGQWRAKRGAAPAAPAAQ